jgi:AcrR family transcriptional regulator
MEDGLMDPAAGTGGSRRGWADKREAIGRGARVVFARDGYARASIDAIALEASVSTRTIYNHFGDKETLFTSVVTDSSARVRDVLIERTRQHLDFPEDLEASLVAVAHAWVATMEEFAEHFALIRLITSEANHFPLQARAAWQNTGPEAARGELARHFGLLARQGLLAAEDPHRAATHFHLLAFAEIMERSQQGAATLDRAEVDTIITAGIRTFLHGHLRR